MSGLAASASIACVVVCLVVSLPADDNRIRNAPISSSVNRLPSTSALTIAVIKSSPGLARRNFANSAPVLANNMISLMVSIARSSSELYSSSLMENSFSAALATAG